MRVLGDTLTASQLAMGDAKLKIVLTKSGQSTLTYYIDSGDDRILSCRHTEQEWSQTATVTVQDSSHTLADLDLRGYKGVISYGYGANYSPSAPLWVIAQRTDSTSGSVRTTFELEGTFDLMARDKALSAFTPDDSNVTKVLNMLVFAIRASAGWTYSHTTAYVYAENAGFTGGQNTVSTFSPGDDFRINFKESRLAVIKKLMAWSDNKLRVEDDEAVHILLPVISGSTYDYEYNDADTYHNFYGKTTRKRIVIPNKITVSSHPDYADSYTGEADDTTNDGDLVMEEPYYFRVESNDECDKLAASILFQAQVSASGGSGFAPMNCGQEIFDYVAITDSKTGDTKTGNIGYIVRNYSQGRFTMGFSFGKLPVGSILGSSALGTTGGLTLATLMEAYNELRTDLNQLVGTTGDIVDYLVSRRYVVPRWHIEKQAIMPVRIPGAPIVTTEAVEVTGSTTATGNITITDLGVPNPTAYGVCYNTTGDPDISDTKTDEGTPTGSGAFTSNMTGLPPNTKHYLRGYATNTTGTGYGIQIIFTTEAA